MAVGIFLDSQLSNSRVRSENMIVGFLDLLGFS